MEGDTNQRIEKFKGFYAPNTTPVPDNFFDELLADLSGAEVKIVCYVMRRTFGFKRQSDSISISQMLTGIQRKDGTRLDRGTGLTKPTLLRALRSLKERNVLLAERRQSVSRGDEATEYRLNIIGEPRGKKMSHGGEAQNFTTPVVKKLDHPVVKKSYPQETGIQETVLNNVNVYDKSKTGTNEPVENRTDLRKLPDLALPREQIKYIADDIFAALGDTHSRGFYYLVAAKVPERVIRRTLSEIKQGNARSPAKVFTSRMKDYAAERSVPAIDTATLVGKMSLNERR